MLIETLNVEKKVNNVKGNQCFLIFSFPPRSVGCARINLQEKIYCACCYAVLARKRICTMSYHVNDTSLKGISTRS